MEKIIKELSKKLLREIKKVDAQSKRGNDRPKNISIKLKELYHKDGISGYFYHCSIGNGSDYIHLPDYEITLYKPTTLLEWSILDKDQAKRIEAYF